MSVSTHLERAESALRRALINALAEGEDHLLQDLYKNLQSVMDLNKKTKDVIRFTDNTEDYYYNKENMRLQKRSLEVQINVARSTNLPMIIHSRDADNDMIEILKSEYKNGPFRAILHCFSSGEELAYCGLDLDFFISFSGILTFNSAKNIQKIAKNIPLSKILVETDSPYLAPSPVRGSVNEPKNCMHTAQFLSKLRDINFLELSEILYDNSLTVYDKIKVWKDK